MAIQLTQADIDWVIDLYPNMEYNRHHNQFYGELYFKREHQGISIADAFSVRVFIGVLDDHTGLPKVICETDKIQKIAENHKIALEDLHINSGGTFCLAIEGEGNGFFKADFTIQEFFKNALEEFLFQISYFDKYGSFPWGEYAHGYLGYIEKFANGTISLQELFKKLSKEEIAVTLLTNRQSKCLCGKGKKLRKCHPLIWKGVIKMKGELSKWQQ
jgi:hypothetical protein